MTTVLASAAGSVSNQFTAMPERALVSIGSGPDNHVN